MMLTADNYFGKIIGLTIFQNSVLIFYLAIGKVKGGIPPIDICSSDINNCHILYTSPLPHVLMLTAIVVGFATLAVGLALILKIYQNFGSISEDEIKLIKTGNRQELI
jgi:multicomponent Na+:H+ antiporter subunit C